MILSLDHLPCIQFNLVSKSSPQGLKILDVKLLPLEDQYIYSSTKACYDICQLTRIWRERQALILNPVLTHGRSAIARFP